MGVGYIVNIVQIGLPAVALADEGNRGTAVVDPPAHGAVPCRHVRAGGGIGTLGVDQKLVAEIVGFIESCRRGKKLPPVFRRIGDPCAGNGGKLGYGLPFLHFVSHSYRHGNSGAAECASAAPLVYGFSLRLWFLAFISASTCAWAGESVRGGVSFTHFLGRR